MSETVINAALQIGAIVGVFLSMVLALVAQHVYVKISDEAVRTWLYALLLGLWLFVVQLPVFHGGWWWLAPPIFVALLALIMRVDNAKPEPHWLHPW